MVVKIEVPKFRETVFGKKVVGYDFLCEPTSRGDTPASDSGSFSISATKSPDPTPEGDVDISLVPKIRKGKKNEKKKKKKKKKKNKTLDIETPSGDPAGDDVDINL